MVTIQGSFLVTNLGTEAVKYLWNGVELQGVVKMFVYKGVGITLTVQDKLVLPLAELRLYGIKIKEI